MDRNHGILQVNSGFAGGGIDNQTLELAIGLRDAGERVMLGVPPGQRLQPLLDKSGVQHFFFPPISPCHNASIRSWAREIRQGGFDIIHAHMGRDYWPAILAARLSGRRVQVVITRHLVTRPHAMSRLFLLSQAHVIAVSKAVEDVLRRNLKGPSRRLHQIYGGVDTQAFRPSRSPDAEAIRLRQKWGPETVVFGVIGRISLPGGKGQRQFVEAAAQLHAEFPNARFAMIGKGRMVPELEKRIAETGLGEAATIIPFTIEMPALMQALDVIVHPAVEPEALGIVLWEGMACGKPVIGSRLDGIPEAFIEGKHGLVVPPREIPALREAMRLLLQSPEVRAQFGAAGRDHVVRNFSREAHINRMRDFYRALRN